MKKNKKTKDKKRKLDIYKIISIILILSSIVLLGTVIYINVLPLKYLALFLGILLLLNLIIYFILSRKKLKKKLKKIFATISIIISIVFLLGSFYIYKTFGVIEDMTQKYKTYTYHVLVKNESNYQNIKELENKTLGYYNNNDNITKTALKELEKTIKTKNEGFGNLETLTSSILNNKSDALLIEDTQKKKLDSASNNASSENTLSGFSTKTRVLYTFEVKVKLEDNTINITRNTFNVYISGMDEYGKVSEISRSDVNIVLTINPKTKQILITNIPRDYYVKLHDTTGYNDKLTHAGIYGIDTSITTIEDLLGIKIDYYFKVNFSSLQKIIDALGGVEVYSEYSFQSFNGYNFTKGYNKVNGKEALAFVRERKSFNDGDNQRGKNQQAMIEAMFRKCTSPEIIVKYNSLLNSLKDSMITNMSTRTMVSLVKMQLSNNTNWTITSNSLSGTGSYDYTYTYPYQSLYVTVPSEDSLTNAKDLIEKVSSGEMLESSYDQTIGNVHTVTKSNVSKNTVSSSSNNKTNKTEKPKKEEPKEEIKKEETKEELPEVVEPENNENQEETKEPEIIEPEEDKTETNPPIEQDKTEEPENSENQENTQEENNTLE